MKTATLLFLVKKEEGVVNSICLAMKKRGFGEGRFNGVGGKVENGEEIETAAKREAEEEIKVKIESTQKVGELTFIFPHEPTWNQVVHVFTSESWEGEPEETEEMKPEWFNVNDIPYEKMWSDDILWLPYVLQGKKVSGTITFAPGDVTVSHDVKVENV